MATGDVRPREPRALVADEEARRRLVASRTTLLGLVQHAAAVERFFFLRTLAGLAPEEVEGLSDATDVSWEVDPRRKHR